MPDDAWDDLDSDITVNAIVSALEAGGHRATFLEGNLSLVETLPALKPDICLTSVKGTGAIAARRMYRPSWRCSVFPTRPAV